MYLYRGMNEKMFKELNGKLTPRGIMTIANLYPSEFLFPSEELTPGDNQLNAIDKHQNSNRFNEDNFKENSAYLSTTPHFERARHYATKNNSVSGYIFYINRTLLKKYGVKEFIVSNIATIITVPEDDEVLILTEPIGSSVKNELILKIEKVEPIIK